MFSCTSPFKFVPQPNSRADQPKPSGSWANRKYILRQPSCCNINLILKLNGSNGSTPPLYGTWAFPSLFVPELIRDTPAVAAAAPAGGSLPSAVGGALPASCVESARRGGHVQPAAAGHPEEQPAEPAVPAEPAGGGPAAPPEAAVPDRDDKRGGERHGESDALHGRAGRAGRGHPAAHRRTPQQAPAVIFYKSELYVGEQPGKCVGVGRRARQGQGPAVPVQLQGVLGVLSKGEGAERVGALAPQIPHFVLRVQAAQRQNREQQVR